MLHNNVRVYTHTYIHTYIHTQDADDMLAYHGPYVQPETCIKYGEPEYDDKDIMPGRVGNMHAHVHLSAQFQERRALQ